MSLTETAIAIYIFLAKVKGAVITSDFIYGKEDIEDTLDALIYDTERGMGAELYVFPAKMCFACEEDAAEAMEEMRNETD